MNLDKNESILSDVKIDALTKEIQATRSLMIKTDNLIQNLHHEVKESRRESRYFGSVSRFKSFVAYTLFAVLSFSGLYFSFQSKSNRTEKTKHELSLLRANIAQLDRSRQEQVAKEQLQNDKVRNLFELYKSGERDKALAIYQELIPELQSEGYFVGFIQSVIEAPREEPVATDNAEKPISFHRKKETLFKKTAPIEATYEQPLP
jgi:hypothetical protein